MRPLHEHPVEVVGRIKGGICDPLSSILQVCGSKVRLSAGTEKSREFQLDGLWNSESLTGFYKEFLQNRIEQVRGGGNATLIFYGPTGSGKTHTMFGSASESGLLASILEQLMNDGCTPVTASGFEVYNEELYDLSACLRQRLEIRNGKAQHAMSVTTSDISVMVRHLEALQKVRATKATISNDRSSRSHCFVVLEVASVGGRIKLVDMAGSEHFDQASMTDEAKFQSGKINQGNSALKRVIDAIASNEPHVPFRDSKLTMLLQDSFKHSKVLMVLCLSPLLRDMQRTLSTLEYGSKAKSIVRAAVPEMLDVSVNARIRELQRQCEYRDQQLGSFTLENADFARVEHELDVRLARCRLAIVQEQELLEYKLRSKIAEAAVLQALVPGKIYPCSVETGTDLPCSEFQATEEVTSGTELAYEDKDQYVQSGVDITPRSEPEFEEQCRESTEQAKVQEETLKKVQECSSSDDTERDLLPELVQAVCEVIVQWEQPCGEFICAVSLSKLSSLAELRDQICPKVPYLKQAFQFLILGNAGCPVNVSSEPETRVLSLPHCENNVGSRLAVLRPITRTFKKQQPPLTEWDENKPKPVRKLPQPPRKISLRDKGLIMWIA